MLCTNPVYLKLSTMRLLTVSRSVWMPTSTLALNMLLLFHSFLPEKLFVGNVENLTAGNPAPVKQVPSIDIISVTAARLAKHSVIVLFSEKTGSSSLFSRRQLLMY